jgi:hypothetical protein
MDIVKAAFRKVGGWIRKIRDWSSGDDLNDAQQHRGDDHERRANPSGPGAF